MENYKQKQYISRGAQAETYVATQLTTKKDVVLKIAYKQHMTAQQIENMKQEQQILASLQSEFVIQQIDAFETDFEIVSVLQFAPYGDLERQIQTQTSKIDESILITWFMELLLGLKHIHEKKIIHRDIKLSNIVMIDDPRYQNCKAMICDFGVSTQFDDSLNSTAVGTPFYMSPQICRNELYSYKTDIYSMGVVFYRLATFKYPYQADNNALLKLKIIQGGAPEISGYSEELKNIIKSMMAVEEKDRPEIDELLKMDIFRDRLAHYGYLKVDLIETIQGSQDFHK